jgi:Tol biopolymer transport system component
VHDPELSPDDTHMVFSQVNPDFKNFPSDPNANTAHDIYIINVDGSGLTRVTQPGPISIVPDWKGNWLLYLELTDKSTPPYLGISRIHPDGSGHQRIKPNANIAKFIP